MKKRLLWLLPLVLGLAAPAVAKPGHSQVFVMSGHRGRLGAEVITMSDALRAHFGAPAGQGVLVNDVVPGSPAEKAGLAAGDVIVSVAGQDVKDAMEVVDAMAGKKKGDTVALEVVRNKQKISLSATLDSDAGAAAGGFGAMQKFDLGDLPDGAWHGVFATEPDLADKLAKAQQKIEALEKRIEALEKRK